MLDLRCAHPGLGDDLCVDDLQVVQLVPDPLDAFRDPLHRMLAPEAAVLDLRRRGEQLALVMLALHLALLGPDVPQQPLHRHSTLAVSRPPAKAQGAWKPWDLELEPTTETCSTQHFLLECAACKMMPDTWSQTTM